MKKQGRKKRPSLFLIIPFLLLAVTGVFFGVRLYGESNKFLPVGEIVFYGNTHLSDSELRAMTGIKGEGILHLQGKTISERLLKSPWIRNVSIRKDMPGRISVKIQEAAPFAILEMKGRAFLVDERGKMLEETDSAVPFLPVITADPFKDKDNFMEAIHLAKVLKEMKIAAERNRVEIIADKGPEGINMIMDGLVIKIGSGDYERKLQRLFQLEGEIKKRAITVDYVDLRFANKVVVKPMNEVVR